MLADHLRAAGNDVVVTREPGGAPAAEAIRNLLVTGDVDAWSPLAETLMMYAARSEHLKATINPARDRGAIVVCDRFSDSTLAYQGAAGAVSAGFIEALDREVVGSDAPTLTIVLDVDDATARSRLATRDGPFASGETRFERKGTAYRQAVREAFRRIAAANARDHFLVDASADAGAVAAQVAARVDVDVEAWRGGDG